MVEVPLSEISFHPMSFADPGGRVFLWKDQLYRGITYDNVDFIRQLFDEGIVQKLIDKGLLVQTEITDLSLEGYGLVLSHGTVPFVSYGYEWCADMLQDAARLIVNLELELSRYNLTLQDAHPWNILFNASQPVYIDFGSIRPTSERYLYGAYEEFCRCFIRPLQLTANGYGRLARWLMHDHQGVLKPELDILIRNGTDEFGIGALKSKLSKAVRRVVSIADEHMPTPFRPTVKKGYKLLKAALLGSEKPDLIGNFSRVLTGITIPYTQTEWSQYSRDRYPSFTPCADWMQKHHSVYRVLSDLHPPSVLDIGSNEGWYSQLAAFLGSKVVALDMDEACVAQLYNEAKKKDLPILPLVMDFCLPSPGYGVSCQEGAPAMARLQCDLVLALALVHHLVFARSLNFEQIAGGLAGFSKRWLLVEFSDPADKDLQRTWTRQCSWYTQETFIAALSRHFRILSTYPSEHASQILLLCEKL